MTIEIFGQTKKYSLLVKSIDEINVFAILIKY